MCRCAWKPWRLHRNKDAIAAKKAAEDIELAEKKAQAEQELKAWAEALGKTMAGSMADELKNEPKTQLEGVVTNAVTRIKAAEEAAVTSLNQARENAAAAAETGKVVREAEVQMVKRPGYR